MKCDVLIVGAGPAGCFLGKLLAERGFSVIILEEHERIGEPVECAGLFSTKVFEVAGISPEKVRGNPIKGARVISKGSSFEFRANEIKAYSVDRALFDRNLAERAERAGAEIFLGWKFRGMRDGRALTDHEEFEAEVYVGADGVRSRMRREIGERVGEIIGASQLETGREIEDDIVEVYPCFSGSYFSWKIPFHERMRVGSAGRNHADAVRKLSGGGEIKRGAIPVGTVRRSVKGNIILLGDSAGQVKPSSFGGVYPSLRCAEIAADAIEKTLTQGGSLMEYERRWRREIGGELSKGMWIHRIFHNLGEERWRRLIESMDEKMREMIVEYGDIEEPSRLAGELIRKRPLKLFAMFIRMFLS
ncbi:MAG: hypothetical protein PWR13_640 [Archaeoglobi archaeon]|nr:NAD(P)/FAD-dependent oxidoreductase [Candidatus Mnemosynella bozhongmuii]MDK2781612.1 hypothetical protein [Archaeoglobi archaeon]